MVAMADRNEAHELITIYEISKILSSSLDLSRTLREVLNILGIQMNTRRGMISLLHESGELHLVGASGMTAEEFQRGRYRVGEGITGRIYQSGMPSVIADISQEPLFLNRTAVEKEIPGKTIAFIGVPIKAGNEILGVLSVDRILERCQHSFDHDVRFLTMIANLVGQTVRLHRAVTAERTQLMEERSRLKKELQGKYSLGNVIGISKAMQEVFAEVHQSAPSRSTMLVRGESGTGKEVIARAIHYLSPRKDGPFIKLNCAALSETLLESELFGHEKGAFTGAQSERKGRFELANGGTLFLDEIGDISPAFQAKLLRVLQEREFERVGGSRSIKVDVRLITATNRDLEQAVAKGDFRADLYYRINVVSIFIPPLRERREDIPYLVEHFLDKFRRENQREIVLSQEALNSLMNCYWPGNVRQLENCIERTATMARGKVISDLNLSCTQNKCLTQLLHEPEVPVPVAAIGRFAGGNGKAAPGVEPATASSAEPAPSSERERLIWALEQCGWVQAKAARLLNISARQMGYALLKHEIEVKKF
jgi:Nif-specific regulatory protein